MIYSEFLAVLPLLLKQFQRLPLNHELAVDTCVPENFRKTKTHDPWIICLKS